MNHSKTKWMKTTRLILRRIETADADMMFRNWASDPEVTKYLTWPTHTDLNVTRKVIAQWVKCYEQPDFYQWGIVEKESGELIGTISVVKIEESTNTVQMGYCIGRAWWHQGYVAEAMKELLRFFFTEVGVLRVEARYDPRNPNSGKVMIKCGMQKEGLLRQADRNNQGICDVIMCSILKAEWEQPQEEALAYRIEYVDSLAKLRKAYDFSAQLFGEAFTKEESHTYTLWEERLLEKTALLSYCAVGDRIIASIFAYAESPKNVVISSICCDKHYRKQGIGTQLLYVIEKNAARMQFLSVTLAVDAQGEEFFAKNGYERILELDKEKIYQKHFKDTIMNAN